MRWKVVWGLLAVIGGAALVIVYRYKRVDVRALGPVSESWIAAHVPDEPD